jgi:hypothetical protein
MVTFDCFVESALDGNVGDLHHREFPARSIVFEWAIEEGLC